MIVKEHEMWKSGERVLFWINIWEEEDGGRGRGRGRQKVMDENLKII